MCRGDDGWFLLSTKIGEDLGISDCAWATPANNGQPTVHNVTNVTGLVEQAPTRKRYHDPSKPCREEVARFEKPESERVTAPLPHTYLTANDIPASFDWRNVNQTDYTTWNKNQHIPKCNSAPSGHHSEQLLQTAGAVGRRLPRQLSPTGYPS